MRAKAWLVENGHLEKDGRGRLPLRVLSILEDARKSGTTFSDWPKGTVEVSTDASTNTKTVVVKRDASSHEKMVHELAPENFPENEFVVFERLNGRRSYRSLREACNNCRVSLVQCHCGTPTIVARNGKGSVSVYIERR